ncbi:hypothetical protein HDE_12496 [Halotydeus destructor]|nr:hypothetical protein HDE_12496 [Halotydeus destructor]
MNSRIVIIFLLIILLWWSGLSWNSEARTLASHVTRPDPEKLTEAESPQLEVVPVPEDQTGSRSHVDELREESPSEVINSPDNSSPSNSQQLNNVDQPPFAFHEIEVVETLLPIVGDHEAEHIDYIMPPSEQSLPEVEYLHVVPVWVTKIFAKERCNYAITSIPSGRGICVRTLNPLGAVSEFDSGEHVLLGLTKSKVMNETVVRISPLKSFTKQWTPDATSKNIQFWFHLQRGLLYAESRFFWCSVIPKNKVDEKWIDYHAELIDGLDSTVEAFLVALNLNPVVHSKASRYDVHLPDLTAASKLDAVQQSVLSLLGDEYRDLLVIYLTLRASAVKTELLLAFENDARSLLSKKLNHRLEIEETVRLMRYFCNDIIASSHGKELGSLIALLSRQNRTSKTNGNYNGLQKYDFEADSLRFFPAPRTEKLELQVLELSHYRFLK